MIFAKTNLGYFSENQRDSHFFLEKISEKKNFQDFGSNREIYFPKISNSIFTIDPC